MKDILLNLLFILVMIFATQFFLDTRGRTVGPKTKALFISITSFVSIMFCMTFTLTADEQFRFDLRVIPYLLGGLFGGPAVSLGLFASMTLFRFMLDFHSGLWLNLFNYGSILILLILLYRPFMKSGVRWRTLIAAIILVFHILLSQFTYNYLMFSGVSQLLFLKVSAIKLASAIFILFLIEAVAMQQKFRDRLEAIEKMELVSHLSASVSHEVRNGLTGALGFLQLLREKETDPKRLTYFRFAADELLRTENIIRDFLTFAKPAPKQQTHIQIEQVINNSISIIEPLANMNSIEIRKSLQPFSIEGDESLLRQAFINILKNAIEAMPNGGSLDIHMLSDHSMNIVVFKDTGIGMTMEQVNRMGTPYYTTKGQKGTGLGMMVTYRIIQQLNGKIKVYSQVGTGTTFMIYLPKPSSE